uniref:Uncharacterized protein n=1 Tax=virus sp. ctLl75 TaxID=2828249 RepID=A0A8S5RBH9_9VIRU|nr:MAG TPA: hypothetical protein [virus sp. ctLl75]DAN52373.1 MAG TPA: hypothetical protein [Caudoviricetes sp.]
MLLLLILEFILLLQIVYLQYNLSRHSHIGRYQYYQRRKLKHFYFRLIQSVSF